MTYTPPQPIIGPLKHAHQETFKWIHAHSETVVDRATALRLVKNGERVSPNPHATEAPYANVFREKRNNG